MERTLNLQFMILTMAGKVLQVCIFFPIMMGNIGEPYMLAKLMISAPVFPLMNVSMKQLNLAQHTYRP